MFFVFCFLGLLALSGPKGVDSGLKDLQSGLHELQICTPDTQKSAFGSIQNCDTRFKADVLIKLLEFPVYLILDRQNLNKLHKKTISGAVSRDVSENHKIF